MEIELNVDLMELSPDEIMRKIRAYKNDENLLMLSLYVRRKEAIKSASNLKLKNSTMMTGDTVIYRRNLNKTQKAPKIVLEQANEEDELCKKISELNKNYGVNFKQSRQPEITFAQTDSAGEEEDILDILQQDKRITRAKELYREGKYDNSISILKEILQEIELKGGQSEQFEGDRQRKRANVTFELGNCYYRLKNYEKAIEFYSIEIAQEDYKHKAMRKSNLGAIYLHLNKNQESLRNYTQALKIYGQCGCEDVDLSNAYHNIGNIYMRERMFDIASKYFHFSLEERKLKSPQAEQSLFNSAFKLGISLKNQQKYEESIKSLFYAESLGERGIGPAIEVYKQIANVYQLLGKKNEALTYYQKISDSSKSTEDDKGYAYERAGLIYIGDRRHNQGQKIIRMAENCYQRSGNERKISHVKKLYKKDLQ